MRHFTNIPQGGVAFSLWPFGVFWRAQVGDECSVLHEKYHYDQQRQWLLIPWLVAYFTLALIYRTMGPRHPMEREAYRLQRECRDAH